MLVGHNVGFSDQAPVEAKKNYFLWGLNCLVRVVTCTSWESVRISFPRAAPFYIILYRDLSILWIPDRMPSRFQLKGLQRITLIYNDLK